MSYPHPNWSIRVINDLTGNMTWRAIRKLLLVGVPFHPVIKQAADFKLAQCRQSAKYTRALDPSRWRYANKYADHPGDAQREREHKKTAKQEFGRGLQRADPRMLRFALAYNALTECGKDHATFPCNQASY
ncbi:hypothetical protein V5F29_18610 [Xanthobacter aminoxidans]|uniref:hypothetical protein n=1 Tax=Xanthobacter aminoxidans TaxID=186280 RepID=UPI00372B31F2